MPIRLLTTFLINSGVRWSLKMVTILSWRRKFSRWPLSGISLLATSWILFYESVKRIKLLTTLFTRVLSVGHQLWSQSYIRIASFPLLTSLSQYALSNFVFFYKALMPIRLLTAFLINNGVRWSLKMPTILSLRRNFFLLTSFSQFPSKIVISFLRISGTCIEFNLFIQKQCCLCWSQKLVTIVYQHRMFLCRHLFYSSLLFYREFCFTKLWSV